MISPFKHHRRSGQAALVMLLVFALGLIFFAITLNWGRIANTKTQTTIAANTAASAMASNVASYGEQGIQTTLGGRARYCKATSIITAIATLIIAIVVCIVSWGAATPLVAAVLIASIVLAAANLAIQVLVIQPGINGLWNKLQSKMATEDRFIEAGVTTAMQSAVSDPGQIPDFFDADTDGKFFDNSNKTRNLFLAMGSFTPSV
jgi:hypothetical protein